MLDRGTMGFISAAINHLEFAVDKYSKMSPENKVEVKKMITKLKDILSTEGILTKTKKRSARSTPIFIMSFYIVALNFNSLPN